MPKWLPRAGFILLHVVQYLVSSSAGLVLSSIVAALMIGAQVLPREHFSKVFRTRQNLVSQLGSVLWLFVSFLEMSAGSGMG
jgi:hypothetical protein